MGGGGSSTFQPHQFNSDIALGLLWVEIASLAWVMDNIVFVPESSAVALIAVELLGLIGARITRDARKSRF